MKIGTPIVWTQEDSGQLLDYALPHGATGAVSLKPGVPVIAGVDLPVELAERLVEVGRCAVVASLPETPVVTEPKAPGVTEAETPAPAQDAPATPKAKPSKVSTSTESLPSNT